ncbi:hypothetical protein ABT294_44980 [Nonomuraea sp. NPDC000554]|uniref:hypothetical protein n=1 Tax=Nonomuraea sp. NPDC000554 TaxID=3154259 RepID=UPI00332046A2
MNVGIIELLIIAGFLLGIAAVIAVIVFVAVKVARRAAPNAPRGDLAARVRQLKASGRTEQAIHLVCGETGMDQMAATRFVESI